MRTSSPNSPGRYPTERRTATAVAVRVESEDGGPTRGGVEQVEQQPDGRRLARAVRPDEPEHLAGQRPRDPRPRCRAGGRIVSSVVQYVSRAASAIRLCLLLDGLVRQQRPEGSDCIPYRRMSRWLSRRLVEEWAQLLEVGARDDDLAEALGLHRLRPACPGHRAASRACWAARRWSRRWRGDRRR